MKKYPNNLNYKNNHFFIELFEKRLSEYTGAPYVVLVDSCTNAIFLSLILFKKYKKTKIKKITIPKRTYISVGQSVIHAGFKLKEKSIKWKGSYKLGKLPIYDCAVGLKPDMYYPGTYQCLSFQQKKAIGIGKGGAILLDNKEDYNLLKRLSWDGRDSSTSTKLDKNIILGYHMNMIPDDAAKGILLLNQYKFNKKDIKTYKDY
jgi:dTDP-4-amino-4,6-dideoxygalactose transaminase